MLAIPLTRRAAVQRVSGAIGMSAFNGHCAHTGAAVGPPHYSAADVTSLPDTALSDAEREQHAIFLSLAMSLTFDGWGVDARRADLVSEYRRAEPARTFPSYLGHNVGALLVDTGGRPVCFALNRNVVLNSTLEHAEARAVRAAIDRANADRPQGGADSWTYGQLLKSDRVYATLEPCAQCAGIMNLANIGMVIYGQDDPAQHHISSVLYNLNHAPPASDGSLPVQATFASWWQSLAVAYAEFLKDPPEGRRGVTSFLETVGAYRVFAEATQSFSIMRPKFAENETALARAHAFRAQWKGEVGRGLVPI